MNPPFSSWPLPCLAHQHGPLSHELAASTTCVLMVLRVLYVAPLNPAVIFGPAIKKIADHDQAPRRPFLTRSSSWSWAFSDRLTECPARWLRQITAAGEGGAAPHQRSRAGKSWPSGARG